MSESRARKRIRKAVEARGPDRLAEAEGLLEETLDCLKNNWTDLGHDLDEMRRKLVDWAEYRHGAQEEGTHE